MLACFCLVTPAEKEELTKKGAKGPGVSTESEEDPGAAGEQNEDEDVPKVSTRAIGCSLFSFKFSSISLRAVGYWRVLMFGVKIPNDTQLQTHMHAPYLYFKDGKDMNGKNTCELDAVTQFRSNVYICIFKILYFLER